MAAYTGGTSVDLLRVYVEREIAAIKPQTVVDFGAGAGKMGAICREILGSAAHLTAVEACPSTITILRDSGIYDKVELALLQDWIASNSDRYDLAIFGDVLEHLARREAFAAVDTALSFARNVIINVPLHDVTQNPMDENPLEIHKSYLTERSFDRRYGMTEKHVINHAGTFYYMFNAWVFGRRKFRLKTKVKHYCFLCFGRRAVAVFRWLGYDSYVGP
jgi:predicted RNA methylase